MMKNMGSRQVRLRGVLLMYAGYFLTIGSFCVAKTTAYKWTMLLAIPAVMVTMTQFWKLSQWSLPYAQHPRTLPVGRRPDERQAAVRDRAMGTAFLITSTLLMFGALYMMMACDFPALPKPTRSEHWGAIIWGLALFTSTLQSAVVAWKEPDDEPEESATEAALSR